MPTLELTQEIMTMFNWTVIEDKAFETLVKALMNAENEINSVRRNIHADFVASHGMNQFGIDLIEHGDKDARLHAVQCTITGLHEHKNLLTRLKTKLKEDAEKFYTVNEHKKTHHFVFATLASDRYREDLCGYIRSIASKLETKDFKPKTPIIWFREDLEARLRVPRLRHLADGIYNLCKHELKFSEADEAPLWNKWENAHGDVYFVNLNNQISFEIIEGQINIAWRDDGGAFKHQPKAKGQTRSAYEYCGLVRGVCYTQYNLGHYKGDHVLIYGTSPPPPPHCFKVGEVSALLQMAFSWDNGTPKHKFNAQISIHKSKVVQVASWDDDNNRFTSTFGPTANPDPEKPPPTPEGPSRLVKMFLDAFNERIPHTSQPISPNRSPDILESKKIRAARIHEELELDKLFDDIKNIRNVITPRIQNAVPIIRKFMGEEFGDKNKQFTPSFGEALLALVRALRGYANLIALHAKIGDFINYSDNLDITAKTVSIYLCAQATDYIYQHAIAVAQKKVYECSETFSSANKFRDDALYAILRCLNEIEAIHKTPNLNLAERWKIYAGGISQPVD